MSWARARAASLALTISIALISTSRGYSSPATSWMLDSSGSIRTLSGTVTTFVGCPAAYATSAVRSFIRLPTGSWALARLDASTSPERMSNTAYALASTAGTAVDGGAGAVVGAATVAGAATVEGTVAVGVGAVVV